MSWKFSTLPNPGVDFLFECFGENDLYCSLRERKMRRKIGIDRRVRGKWHSKFRRRNEGAFKQQTESNQEKRGVRMIVAIGALHR